MLNTILKLNHVHVNWYHNIYGMGDLQLDLTEQVENKKLSTKAFHSWWQNTD